MTDSPLWTLASLTPAAPGLLQRPASSSFGGLGSLGLLTSPTATGGGRGGIVDMLLSPAGLHGQASWQHTLSQASAQHHRFLITLCAQLR